MMKRLLLPFFFPLLAVLLACGPSMPSDTSWEGYAKIADGRKIPFVLELDASSVPPTAGFRVGDELIPVPEVVIKGDSVHLIIDEYDAAFRLRWSDGKLSGRYERYRSDTSGFDIMATPGPTASRPPSPDLEHPLMGSFTLLRSIRNSVDSSLSAYFWARGDSIFGTVIAPSGDDGLLAGQQIGDTVRLARFTGWQSIYLELVRSRQGWQGLRFIRGESPSMFELSPVVEDRPSSPPSKTTRLRRGQRQFSFAGITPEGDTLDQSHERFRGKALIVDIMGTWCHNCLDAAPVLQRVYEEYGPLGLEIVSLSFELRDDADAGRRNLKIFRERHGLTYTMLFAGDLSDENVSKRIGSQLEDFGAYPTALFIDRAGRVVSIHKGFKGPGTGSGYQEEIHHFTELAKKLTHD